MTMPRICTLPRQQPRACRKSETWVLRNRFFFFLILSNSLFHGRMWVAVTEVDRTERMTNTEVSGPLPLSSEQRTFSCHGEVRQPAKRTNVQTTLDGEKGEGASTLRHCDVGQRGVGTWVLCPVRGRTGLFSYFVLRITLYPTPSGASHGVWLDNDCSLPVPSPLASSSLKSTHTFEVHLEWHFL